jgi:outer membrane biosynthesis protein TonB
MMTAATMRVSFRAPVLPWSVATADDTRFRRIWQTVLAICTLACFVILLLPVVKPDRSRPQELPPVMAKLLLDKAPTPPAPPVKPAPVQAAPQVATAPLQPEAARPVPPPKPIKPQLQKETLPDAKTPVPNQAPGESTEGARRKAASVGLFAANEDLAPLRAKATAVQLNPDIKQGPGVGTGTGAGVGAGNEDGVPTRAMITSNATTGSGGISSAAFSRNTGGAGLGGKSTTLVAGGFANGVDGGTGSGGGARGAGGRGGEGNGTGTGTGKGGTLNKGGGGKASRSIEEIKLVFERNKGAIYAIYNRALREDPALQGKVVLELTIAPSGALTGCRIVSSELHAAELEGKLLARIRQFDFGAKDVDQIIVTWPVDFLPS